jgi:hypothetical protein
VKKCIQDILFFKVLADRSAGLMANGMGAFFNTPTRQYFGIEAFESPGAAGFSHISVRVPKTSDYSFF